MPSLPNRQLDHRISKNNNPKTMFKKQVCADFVHHTKNSSPSLPSSKTITALKKRWTDVVNSDESFSYSLWEPFASCKTARAKRQNIALHF